MVLQSKWTLCTKCLAIALELYYRVTRSIPRTFPNNVLLTNRKLDFRDVARGLRSVEEGLTANPGLSVGSLLVEFSKSIPQNSPSSAQTVKIVAIVVGGLIVLALLYYWICEDSTSASPLCPLHDNSRKKKDEGKVDDTDIR